MTNCNPFKFKILSILIVVVYALTFISHSKDFSDGFKEGYSTTDNTTESYNNVSFFTIDNTEEHALNSKLETQDKALFFKVKQDIQEVKVEYNSISPMYDILDITLSIFGLLTLLSIVISLFVLLKFLLNMFHGIIVTKPQIKRLRFIVYVQLAFALLNNVMVIYYNHIHQILLKPFNLTLIKDEIDYSLFFIPLILFVILEILKQHLKIKEEQELTI